jgi:hypothetical protein
MLQCVSTPRATTLPNSHSTFLYLSSSNLLTCIDFALNFQLYTHLCVLHCNLWHRHHFISCTQYGRYKLHMLHSTCNTYHMLTWTKHIYHISLGQNTNMIYLPSPTVQRSNNLKRMCLHMGYISYSATILTGSSWVIENTSLTNQMPD